MPVVKVMLDGQKREINMKYLIVDGMFHGTGIRDKYEGGYLSLTDLNLPDSLIGRIQYWLKAYEQEHYNNFQNSSVVNDLDQEGVSITKLLKDIFPNYKFSYYSSAQMQGLCDI